jgi:hypothetical protein
VRPVDAAIGFEPHHLAIACATETVPLRTMMRCGLGLDLACVGAMTVMALTFWR